MNIGLLRCAASAGCLAWRRCFPGFSSDALSLLVTMLALITPFLVCPVTMAARGLSHIAGFLTVRIPWVKSNMDRYSFIIESFKGVPAADKATMDRLSRHLRSFDFLS